MKKNQIKSHSKGMKGNGKQVAGEIIGIRQSEHEERIKNYHGSIEAAEKPIQEVRI